MAIAEGRHVDVLEMDAASHTGVGDIREIIDSVRYRAASARYKVYIIDEVHMLSTSAFNALLKTLEEPPEHVKFIFATTEIRKVPVTVLSPLPALRPAAHRARDDDGHAAPASPEAEGAEVDDGGAGADHASRRGLGPRRAVAARPGDRPRHRRDRPRRRSATCWASRTAGRVLDLFDLVMRGDAAGALAELARNTPTGPTRWRFCAIWPR